MLACKRAVPPLSKESLSVSCAGAGYVAAILSQVAAALVEVVRLKVVHR